MLLSSCKGPCRRCTARGASVACRDVDTGGTDSSLSYATCAVQECIAAAEQAELAQAKSLAVRQASASSSGVSPAAAEEDTDSDGGAQPVHSALRL